MTFSQFNSKYDFQDSIVLLEGKRNVKDQDKERLVKLGELLARNTKHIVFRSGNSNGADFYFSLGVSNVDWKRLEVILPFKGYRKTLNKSYSSIALDDLNLLSEKEVILQSKTNKKTEKLIDPFLAGNRNRLTLKSSFIIRDTVKVIGTKSGIKPSIFGLFYDDLSDPGLGGTGHTMKVCECNQVPFFNQQIWFAWVQ